MNKFMKTCACLAAVAAAAVVVDASAATDVFNNAQSTLKTTFTNVRTVVYLLGAFGLIGVAAGAILGKIKWSWLGALAGGLAIVAMADGIVNYAIQKPGTQKQATNYGYSEYDIK